MGPGRRTDAWRLSTLSASRSMLERWHFCLAWNGVCAIVRDPAFDAGLNVRNSGVEFDALSVARPDKFGRDIAFSSYRVAGSWRGARSGVRISAASEVASTMSFEMGHHRFTLGIPLLADLEWNIPDRRLLREHGQTALLLSILLVGRVRCQSLQTGFSCNPLAVWQFAYGVGSDWARRLALYWMGSVLLCG